jgi:hypothetical protein
MKKQAKKCNYDIKSRTKIFQKIRISFLTSAKLFISTYKFSRWRCSLFDFIIWNYFATNFAKLMLSCFQTWKNNMNKNQVLPMKYERYSIALSSKIYTKIFKHKKANKNKKWSLDQNKKANWKVIYPSPIAEERLRVLKI